MIGGLENFRREPQVVLKPINIKGMKLTTWTGKTNDDLRNHLNRHRKITALINPNAEKPIKIKIREPEDPYSEEMLLKDNDNESVATHQIDEDKLLADDNDFLSESSSNLDYTDDTNHDHHDFDAMSIAPTVNEFTDEIGSSSNFKSLKKNDSKRKFSDSEVNINEKVLEWQTKHVENGHDEETKADLSNFKIPKKITPKKKPREDVDHTSYKKQYNTGRNDRINRTVRKNTFDTKRKVNVRDRDNNVNNVFKAPLPTLQPQDKNVTPFFNNNSIFKKENHNSSFKPSASQTNNIFKSSLHQSSKYKSQSSSSSQYTANEKNTKHLHHSNSSSTSLHNGKGILNGPPIMIVRSNENEQKFFPIQEHHSPNIVISKPRMDFKNPRDTVCRHFLTTGKCPFGNSCKFEHIACEEYERKRNPQGYGQFNRSNSRESINTKEFHLKDHLSILERSVRLKDCSQAISAVEKIEKFLHHEDFSRRLSNDEIGELKKAMESMMLVAASDENQNTRMPWVELARLLVSCKALLKNVNMEDYFYCAKVHWKFQEIKRCLFYLTELKINNVENKRLKSDAEHLLLNCIERTGIFFQYWNDFKTIAVHNGSIMDRIFKMVDSHILQSNLSLEDLSICSNEIQRGRMVLSETSKESFLSLYTPKTNVNTIIDLLKTWSDLSSVPSITVEKILQNIHSADIVSTLSVLKRIPSNTLNNCAKQWNEFLEISCKKNNLQESEQVFGVMQQAKIGLEVDSSLQLLSALAKNSHFPAFLARYNEVKKFFEEENYVFPEWFSETISECLELYIESDWNVLYRLISILIMSSIPPLELKINELLKMLRLKRRFQETFDLVIKCFARNVILSQTELRKTIIFLEEWTSNYQASISVYSKMREAYNRPEHLCYCHSVHDGGQCRSKATSSSNSDAGFIEPGFPTSRSSVLEPSDLTVPVAESKAQKLSLLFGQFTASGGAIDVLVKTYMKAINMDAANDDKVVFGLFFAISAVDDLVDAFELFVESLQKEYVSFSNDMQQALGRIGVRLIKHICDNESVEGDNDEEGYYARAYRILEVLHKLSILYGTCGKPFGTMASTQDTLSQCAIVNMCSLVCNRLGQYDSAYYVFTTCNYGFNEGEFETIDMEKVIERNDILHETIMGLITDEILDKAAELYETSQNLLPVPMQTKFANALCHSYCCQGNLSLARKMYKLLEEKKLDLDQQTVGVYISLLSLNSLSHEAQKVFHKALENGLYGGTYDDKELLSLSLSTSLNKVEIRLLIEKLLNVLRTDPVVGEDAWEVPSASKELVITISDANDFKSIRNTLSDVEDVLNNFNPPLAVHRKFREKITISLESIIRWYPMNRNIFAVVSPGAPAVRKKRTVSKVNEQLAIKYCPTPMHTSTSKEDHREVNGYMLGTQNELQSPPFYSKPSFEETDDEIKAKDLIRRKICLCLTPYYQKNLVTKDEFPRFSADIMERFLAKLQEEHGRIFFNEEVSIDAHRFAMLIAEERVS